MRRLPGWLHDVIGTVAVMVVIALGITLVTVWGQREEPKPPPLDPELTWGSSKAPIVIVMFEDFNCPACQVHHEEVHGILVDRYVKTGKVRLVWRDFPKLGEGSVRAAIAARAAARQGQFWEFHDALFERGGATGHLGKTAKRVGLDIDRFQADVKDPKLRTAVAADLQYAEDLALLGTPAFKINDAAPFFGAQYLEVFENTIESRLAEMRD